MLLIVSIPAMAQGAVPYGACFAKAAAEFRVPENLLEAIAAEESSFKARVWHRNANGTVDLGLMQINSEWLPLLASHGFPAEALFDPCTNIRVGAWLLAANIGRYGYRWKAVGAYNAHRQDKQIDYADRIRLRLASARFTPRK